MKYQQSLASSADAGYPHSIAEGYASISTTQLAAKTGYEKVQFMPSWSGV